ncbi:hypothetical protein K461DRAFT_228453 [Myriangium duriaei CBS 260.36]|uniref:HMG box domain-containing protein n=1 Tax=Myriangium duriaei CBS 260.36 TaxID=1168546 RepID=A0A9P4IZD6_9PEZI|nr:hypothetical protein K461DRAFT_228453 [Myriangium duriaei CBS 260.36]
MKKQPSSAVRRLTWRPNSSIPPGLSWEEYGRQCVLAANTSRLNPYALHTGEHRLLTERMSPLHTTAYLNIRNGILRLWTRNPMVSVSEEEAAGCAKRSGHFGLAEFAYWWLVRNGYINFGCVEVPRPLVSPPPGRRSSKQKTIVIIGAGMAGLGCARQLEGLIAQFQNHWIDRGEHPPKIVILEGRKRIGGRVYSHPLRSQVADSLPNGLRNTAEMGAQIITGFQHGNPLDAIVRGQLGLHYHLMWDEIVMHDSNGKAVNRERDILVNKVHNDILERTSDFRLKPVSNETFEGLQDFIDVCQEPAQGDLEETFEEDSYGFDSQGTQGQDRSQVIPPGFAKLQGRTQVVAGNSSSRTAAQAAKSAGWDLRAGISRNHSLNLNNTAKSSGCPTLGSTMDEAIRQYQHLVELTPQDMRLLNWHYADLEYANAAVVHQLSLSGHDQDSGNEFEGRHSEVVGGYIQVPRGLMMLPNQLDVHFDSTVERITYSDGEEGSALIYCKNGQMLKADKVVLTAPLGVLKAQTINFQPRLPDWKVGAIDRLGFGVLNKIVLVFERPFWNEQYDMFGLLNEAEKKNSMNPDDYAKGRGKFYLVWNCINNSGRPMLIALMSGHAAHAAEVTPTEVLMKEVVGRLSTTFAPQPVPAPVEVIVTRWKKDPFTRGTYSFVAPGTQPGDYDVMARPVGNLHFAGEATCGTHPATVHGAYLSGLRAAAEVVDNLIGPVKVPEVLVGDDDDSKSSISEHNIPIHPSIKPPTGRPRKGSKKDTRADAVPAQSTIPAVNPYRSSTSGRYNYSDEHEALVQSKIFMELGERPLRPSRPGVNPFLVYTAEQWKACKASCSKAKQTQTGMAGVQASRNEVRAAIGKQWRELSDEQRRPYMEQGEDAQRLANEARAKFEKESVEWEEKAARIRSEFEVELQFHAVEQS